VELPEAMVTQAVKMIDLSFDKKMIEKDVATEVKKAFDEEHGGTWHCVVGRNFGCSVTHQTKYLVFFQLDQSFVLLFCSDEPATKTQTSA
jgi:dynein light chain LC8-type